MKLGLFSALIASGALFAGQPVLKKIEIRGDESRNTQLQNTIEDLYSGEPLTQEKISEIKGFIANYYKDDGLFLVSVSTPAQEISDGTLQIDVHQSKLGEIEFCGNKWFRTRQLNQYIRLEKGDPIDVDQFSEDLAWMNRNPFRRSDAIFAPGQEPHTTNIKLYVWDRFPVRVYGGFDNRGNDGIGTQRMLAGFYMGNFFNFDHRISYQYTCSLDFGTMNAHTLRYDMPLPWRHEISVFGGYSAVHLKNIGTEFKNHGRNVQASGRYVFPSQKNHVSDVTIGYDYKLTNNNLEFSEIPVFSKSVALGQFLAAYTYQSQPGCNLIFFNLEIYGQPGNYLKHMSNFDYQSLRPEAKNAYLYAKGDFEYTYRFPRREFSLRTRIIGQMSTTNLLPSEELGLGGADTVRGYKERIVNGDNGIVANLEWRWDAFSFLRRKIKCPTCCDCSEQIYDRRRVGDLFSLLAFFDYGFVHVDKELSFELPCAYLMSVGPGARYDFD